MRPQRLPLVWAKVPWFRHLSGLTCSPSTAARGVESWISSLAATRARERATPESVLDAMIRDGCGPGSGGFLSAHARACASSRTSQLTLDGLFGTSMRTFGAWATELKREYSARKKWARRSREHGCSSWPTPNASDDRRTGFNSNGRHVPGLRRLAQQWPTPDAGVFTRSNRSLSPGAAVRPALAALVRQWQTPRVTTGDYTRDGGQKGRERLSLHGQAKAMWPAPTVTNCDQGDDSTADREGSPSLVGIVAEFSRSFPPDRTMAMGGPACSPPPPASRPRLNPDFVEWLMALPRGWTDFAPVGTEYTRWLRRWRSYLFGDGCGEATD